jgi:hypothetical protein
MHALLVGGEAASGHIGVLSERQTLRVGNLHFVRHAPFL